MEYQRWRKAKNKHDSRETEKHSDPSERRPYPEYRAKPRRLDASNRRLTSDQHAYLDALVTELRKHRRPIDDLYRENLRPTVQDLKRFLGTISALDEALEDLLWPDGSAPRRRRRTHR